MSIEAMKKISSLLAEFHKCRGAFSEDGLCEVSVGTLQKISYAQSLLEEAIEEAEKQEPVAWMTEMGDVCTQFFKKNAIGHVNYQDYCVPLYTHPPKRKWVDIDYKDLPAMRGGDMSFLAGVQWGEAKTKELNT
jgi:hypothetical protein